MHDTNILFHGEELQCLSRNPWASCCPSLELEDFTHKWGRIFWIAELLSHLQRSWESEAENGIEDPPSFKIPGVSHMERKSLSFPFLFTAYSQDENNVESKLNLYFSHLDNRDVERHRFFYILGCWIHWAQGDHVVGRHDLDKSNYHCNTS